MGRLTRVLFLLPWAFVAGSCKKDPEPAGPYRLFVPVVIRSVRGVTQWKTKAVVTNPGPSEAHIRAYRWPPANPSLETWDLTLPAGASSPIPSLVPPLPVISSLYVESSSPVSLQVTVQSKKENGPLPFHVPVVPVEDLIHKGDRIIIRGLVKNAQQKSHYVFSLPWTEKDSAPFLARVTLKRPDGGILVDETRAVPGIPWPMSDPWLIHGIPPEEHTLDLEVTLLGGNRGREPRNGMWVYALVQDARTGESRFLESRVERGL